MTAAQHAEFRRRARNLLVFLPLAAITVGTAATQFVAWRLHYHPVLGQPLFQRVYWPWSIVWWWQAPWEPQVDTTFEFVKFGMMLVACVGALVIVKSRQKRPNPTPDIHGTARFSEDNEVRKSSLFPKGKTGIAVGGWTDRRGSLHYLTDAGEGHVLCLGPSRIGKTQAVLVPTLLTWPNSMVVYDPKGELYKLTAGWRHKEADNIVIRFAPAELENTVSWNPFDRVEPGSPFEFRDVANIIQQVADPQGKGFSDHWEPAAANLLNGIALALVSQQKCSLRNVLSVLDSSAETDPMLKLLEGHQTQEIAEIGRGLLATSARERASIISTARRLLQVYRDPVLGRNIGHSDFRIEDLMHGSHPITLYIETRGEDDLRLRPLVRLLLNQIIGRLISIDYEPINPLILAIDELPTLRKMEPLELFLTKGAGAGMRALLLAQDYQDIVAEYGESERITSNCSVLVAHAPNSLRTAEWLSKKTGQATRTVEEISESQGRGGQRTTNRVFRSVPVPLMTPDQVSRLRLPERDARDKITGPGEMLIFQAGKHVIRGTQSLAFRDPEFRRRMAIPAPQTMRTTQ